MEKYETLKQALDDLNWLTINSKEELNKYFDLNNLDEECVPNITASEKTIIVCDNTDWNSNYVIDLVADEFKANNFNNVKLVYINDIELRSYIEKLTLNDNEDISIIEKEKLHPMIIVINPFKNLIIRIQENGVTILNPDVVKFAVKILDDSFVSDF